MGTLCGRSPLGLYGRLMACRRGILVVLSCTATLFAGAGCHQPHSEGSDQMDPLASLIVSSQDLGQAAPTQTVSILLTLKDLSLTRLESDMAAIYDPQSSSYLHFESPEQLRTAYGPDPVAVSIASARLQQRGLRVDWTPGNPWMTATGTPLALAAEFGVQIHNYMTRDGIAFWASPTSPTVPPELAAIVTGSAPLTSYVPVRGAAVPSGGLKPTDLVRAYDLQPL